MTLEQIAADFGIRPMTLSKWLRQAKVDGGTRSGVSSTESGGPSASSPGEVVGAGEPSPAPSRGVSVASDPAPKMMYPLVASSSADGIPVAVTCRVLQLYCRWLTDPVSDRLLDEAWLANTAFDAHRDDPEFGYRFLADEARLADHQVHGPRPS